MEKMWSPWRSNYINSFKTSKNDESCVFCSAASEDMTSDDSLVLFRGKLTFIMLNLYPYNGGHLMIIPNRHISKFQDLTNEEHTEIMSEVDLSIRVFDEVMKPQGYNLGMNLGKAAGAGIDQHLHMHLVPRWNGDTNFMPVIGEVKVISQDLLEIKNSLVEVYKKLSV